MANFDSGLLGFPTDDEEKYREYMLRSLRPDMYDRTQQVGGVDIGSLMNQPQQADSSQSLEMPAEAERPQVPQQEPVQGLLGNVPEMPQQEQQQVEVMESPGVMVSNDNAEALAQGGAAAGGAADMASSAKAADADAKMASQQLEAKRDSMAQQTNSMAMQEHARKQQEQDPFEQIFGLGMQILPYFL